MTKREFGIVLIALVIIGFILSFVSCEREVITKTVTKTDTVKVSVPYQVKVIEENRIPEKVIVYVKDTSLRKKVEKETIIAAVEIKDNKLEVSKIDTAGNVFTDTHDITNSDAVTIDNTGGVEVKEDKKKQRKEKLKKVLRKVGIVAVAIVAFIVGSSI